MERKDNPRSRKGVAKRMPHSSSGVKELRPSSRENKRKNVAESRIPPVLPDGKGIGGHGAKRLNPASQNNSKYIVKKRCPQCGNIHQYQYQTDRVEDKGKLRCPGCLNVW